MEKTITRLIEMMNYCKLQVDLHERIIKSNYAKEDAEWDKFMDAGGGSVDEWDKTKYPGFEFHRELAIFWDNRQEKLMNMIGENFCIYFNDTPPKMADFRKKKEISVS